MTLYNINEAWVLICFEPTFFCEHGTDEKYKHIASFLNAIYIRHGPEAIMFMPKPYLLFLRDIMLFYDFTVTVRENNSATDVAAM